MKKKQILLNFVPKIIFVALLVALWQYIYLTDKFPDAIFPSIPQIFNALVEETANGNMFNAVYSSMSSIFSGLFWGVVMAFILSALAIVSKVFYSIFNLVISVLDLLPGIAIMPVVMVLAGLDKTMLIIMIHSIIWPVSRNIIDGYHATPKIYVEMGKNIGHNPISILSGIYFPASLPHIFSGLKTGWARAWRAFISVEAVFTATASSGFGLGAYIMLEKNILKYDNVYAALIVIMLIGVVIEYLIFANLEKISIRKWGMVH